MHQKRPSPLNFHRQNLILVARRRGKAERATFDKSAFILTTSNGCQRQFLIFVTRVYARLLRPWGQLKSYQFHYSYVALL